jgi:hypothetical protein
MTQATQIIIPVQGDASGIPPYRIAMTSSTQLNRVVLANTATSASLGFSLLGVTGELGLDPNAMGDLTVMGVGYVQTSQVGMPIGSPLTSEVQGKAVIANAVGQRIVGYLLEPTTVLDQICKILVCPGVF